MDDTLNKLMCAIERLEQSRKAHDEANMSAHAAFVQLNERLEADFVAAVRPLLETAEALVRMGGPLDHIVPGSRRAEMIVNAVRNHDEKAAKASK